ncbi:MAG: fumarylacetoacetate hydrolase family protein [Saprospiraceae bacterium]
MKKTLLFLLLIIPVLLPAQKDSAQIKLFRFGPFEQEKPAIEHPDGTRLDVSGFGEDYNEAFFAKDGIKRLQRWLVSNAGKCPLVPNDVRWGSCVARPSKIVAIGLNYVEHIREGQGSAATPPKEPIIFLKSTSALCGPYDDAIIPRNSLKMDWEVELAIIIGKKASYVSEAVALNYVAGYSIMNDYSEREWQLQKDGGQWDKGKSSDHFAPLGPYFILPENIGNPQDLNLSLKLNGKVMQQANTGDMIFNIAQLVSYISEHMTLLPGDVISSGTPSGVGSGHKPPLFLKEGDAIELTIEHIGTQRQAVISFLQSQLTADEWKEYKVWVALGVGGLPHTLEGYRTVQVLNKTMGNPLDISRIEPMLGTKEDKSFIKKLHSRIGPRPTIAPFAIPHRQTNQHNDTTIRALEMKIFETQVSLNPTILQFNTSIFEKNNQALFLKDTILANATMMKRTHGEIAHLHPHDGSMHMTYISASDAKKIIDAGWGEFHGLAGSDRLPPTYVMIYAPRDEKELIITKQILESAIKFATYIPK